MKIKTITSDGIEFDDGTTIEDFHDQDCCENVYADWDQLDSVGRQMEIDEIEIEGVEDAGFKLNGFFIPCYNDQNGYYGSDLSLIITSPDGSKKEIDVSGFVEDKIW